MISEAEAKRIREIKRAKHIEELQAQLAQAKSLLKQLSSIHSNPSGVVDEMGLHEEIRQFLGEEA